MSDDSESSGYNVTPSNLKLEKALRGTVRQIYKVGNLEDLTIRRVRKAVEEELDLREGFFKAHSDWNKKSKDIVQSEVDSQSHEPPSSQQPPHSDIPEAPPEKREAIKKSKAPAKGKKRGSVGEPGPKKRRKKDESDNMESGAESGKPTTKRPVTEAQRRPRTSSSSLSQVEDEELEKVDRTFSASKHESIPSDDIVAKSESEMSAVLDEAPKPKKQRRSAGSQQPKTKKTGRSKGVKASEQPTDPDAEEIKRLQGWLVKCGIRKLWHRELAPYDTAKAKIRHLKELLTDAGMTGRFSIEKATQIREERELKADLEAVQAGAKQWGKAESDEEETGRPKRRLAKGLKELDFLNDDDGEETD